MKKTVLIGMMLCIFAFPACSGKRAEELYETAQFEELQRNRKHATQLYREIIEKYPKSEFAKKAAERLSALEKEGTGTP